MSQTIRCLLLCALLLLCTGLAAEPRSMANENDYKVSLVTTGPGSEVYLWWGHSALMVENQRTRQESFYDFGVFSFETEHFFRNFIFGRLWYMGYRSSAEVNINRTIREDRNIQVQELRFPPGKKLELIEDLENRVSPENRSYLYDYYSDNCATRIRDVLDNAYNGELRRVSEDPRETLRFQTRRYTGRNPFIEWGLMFLMGPRIDKNINGWDAMFLPYEIPVYLDKLTIENGPDTGRKAVSPPRIMHTSKIEPEAVDVPGMEWPLPLGFGVILALLLAAGRYLPAAAPLPLRIIFQILYRALLLLAALAGSILFFIALFTNHTVAHENWNLLLLNPLHWISLIAPYRIQQTEKQQFRAGFLLYLPWIITISTSILLWTLYLTGILNQDITQTAAFLLPVAVSVSCPWLKKVLMP